MRILSILVLGLLLANCSSPSPPPPAPTTPIRGDLVGQPWQLEVWYLGGAKQAPRFLDPGPALTFPSCTPTGVPPALGCSANYVTAKVAGSLTGAAAISLTYTIEGTDPVFSGCTNPNNTCGCTGGKLSLYLQRYGDVWTDPYFRWYAQNAGVPLELGTHTLTVPLLQQQWVPAEGAQNGVLFAQALASVQAVGFVLGSGCFAGHGVAVTSGSARLTLDHFSIQ